MAGKNDLKEIDLLMSTFLITYKDGIAVNKLSHAYYDLNGEYVPFAKYGFSSLHSLLSALPSVELNGSWVRGIPTEKVKHIHKMVAEQKPARNSRGQGRYNCRSSPFIKGRPRNYNSYSGGYSRYGDHRQMNQPRTHNWEWNPPARSNGSYQATNGWDNAPNSNHITNGWGTPPSRRSFSTDNWNKSVSGSSQDQHTENDFKGVSEKSEKNHVPDLLSMAIPLSEGAIDRIKMIMKKKTAGLSGEQLAQCYFEYFPEYKDDLNWKAMNHGSMDDLLKTATDGMFCIAYALSGHVVYMPGEIPSSCMRADPKVSNVHASPSAEEEELATKADAFIPFVMQDLIPDLCDRVKVEIGEIYDPNEFFLIPSLDSPLPALCDEMTQFLTPEKKAELRPTALEAGLPVIVLHSDDTYYRAVIHKHDADSAVVFIVDYGTLADVPKEKVYLIPKKFMTLPIQAFEASLADVKPPNNSDEWETNEAAALLMSLTSGNCTAVIVDSDTPLVQVILTDENASCTINSYFARPAVVQPTVAPSPIMPIRPQSALEKVAASLQLASLSVNGAADEQLERPVATPTRVEVFSSDELSVFRSDISKSLIVSDLHDELTGLLDTCIGTLMKQRDACLSELKNNPERDDVFDYLRNVYVAIKELKHVKNFDSTH